MNQSLRILMVLHVPWDRNLGGSRVQLELADEFCKMGHQVEKFDVNDAFPDAQSSRISELIRPSFSTKAKEFIQANGKSFDVIDAHQGNVPFSKAELNFQGLLVARSVGLYAFCEDYFKLEEVKWPQKKKGNPITKVLRSWRKQREFPYYLSSLKTCDLINLPNGDELNYVRDILGLGYKSVFFPFGLSEQRQRAFFQATQPGGIRLLNKQVAFIGYWTPRKGSKDWPEIIMRTKAQVPDVRFLFLGTGLSPQEVLQDLNMPAYDWIEIIPSYESNMLPQLLSEATIGAFPSYMEGFGFAVLEKLACGLPTIAYDIPGPRDMLRPLDPSLMIPVGDLGKFTAKLIELLQLDEKKYNQLSQNCHKVSSIFSWPKIAKDHLQLYSQYLQSIQKN
ncbi:glycosyltransferase family 4 protein [Roseofilum reptotaenium CS-1145]|uniref:Uncharacterized protein n=1 Tax=Roseofilum reptotaenium AO1-A TaxID=1925591 RepID=A0A1L9QS93_9CYAN|nr:glycosyltransferase family 4 protein [Roseofilum reptotaenium]MDB9518288.1 glycosyltransferase family 4 protein [Roseofilum reptotaenium CS-1145]OJJ25512.1 hypothetical protein BI308_11115 [Roseofilum reptotaenium AO1-A]